MKFSIVSSFSVFELSENPSLTGLQVNLLIKYIFL